MKLLQVSDPHFGTERPEVVDGLLRLAHELVPDVVLFSGDITQRARRGQFAAARRFADALLQRRPAEPPGVLLALPGNHDVPLFNVFARVLSPYAGFRAAFGDELEATWDAPALQITLVKSTRRWRHKNGDISAAQRRRVAARLRQAGPRQLRVVAAHHPLAVPKSHEAHNLARGAQAALRDWAEAGADFVLGGHIHLPALLPVHEALPGLPKPMWVLQAGTATSRRIRHEADNSVNVLRLPDAAAPELAPPGSRRCRVERWDWQPDAGAFAPVAVHELDAGARL
jgi:3',5'-cyclic AMP phosphodiesterase CpdA